MSAFSRVDLPALVYPASAIWGRWARSRSARITERLERTWASFRLSAAIRSRARRRSVSICVSPGPSGADPAVDPAGAEALEVRPQAPHPREVVLELRQLDLELALGGVRVGGEDVEDDRRAVDHRDAERRLEVALLARRELVVAGDEVGVRARDLGLQLLELAGAEVGVRMRMVAALDQLADAGDAGRPQQLLSSASWSCSPSGTAAIR